MSFSPVDIIASYFGWTQYTPALPEFYWDVYSAEQRVKRICEEIDKLCNYVNMLGDNINIDHTLISELQAALANIEQLDEIDAKVVALQEQADNVQRTLDALPSYNQFLSLRVDVDNVEQELTKKLPWPLVNNVKSHGLLNQVLATNADGTTRWANPIEPTNQQAETYINAWLNAHPEATTTVQDDAVTTAKIADGAVTDAKLAQSGGVLEKVGELEDAIGVADFFEDGYINVNGAISSSNNYVHTDYIKIYDGGVFFPYRYKVKTFNALYIGYYDSEKNLVTAVQTTTNQTLVTIEDVISYYEGAVYFRLSTSKTLDDKYCVPAQGYNLRVIENVQNSVGKAAIKDRSISHDKLNEDSVDLNNCAFLSHVQHTNYIGGWVENVFIYDGKERYGEGFYATTFIRMLPETSYYMYELFTGYYAFYDADLNVISSHNNDGTLASPFTTPVGTVYGRFTAVSSVNKDLAWINTINEKPEGYKVKLPDVIELPENSVFQQTVVDRAITNNKIMYNTLAIENCAFITHYPPTDLISGWIEGYRIQDGALRPSVGYYVTDYIPLEQSTNYYWNTIWKGYYAFYDSELNIVEYHNNDASLTNPFTIPVGAVYGRFTVINETFKNSAWLYTSNEKPNPHKYILDTNILVGQNAALNPCDYTGKEITTFTDCLCIGDSLTAGTMNYYANDSTDNYVTMPQYSYPSYLARLSGLDITNWGIGGTTSEEWWNIKQNEDWSGYNIAIVQLGVNDRFRYGEFGDRSKAAFTNIFNKLKTANNHIKIFAANIIPAYTGESFDTISDDMLAWFEGLNDPDIIPLDIRLYGHVGEYEAYKCGHLSALGYNRLAQDYFNYISYYISTNMNVFREVQFIGTDYVFTPST